MVKVEGKSRVFNFCHEISCLKVGAYKLCRGEYIQYIEDILLNHFTGNSLPSGMYGASYLSLQIAWEKLTETQDIDRTAYFHFSSSMGIFLSDTVG